LPIRITLIHEKWIARAAARGTSAGVVLTNRVHWPPQIIAVFIVPAGDAAVGHREINQCEESGVLQNRVVHLLSYRLGDLIVEADRRTQTRLRVVAPIETDGRLVVGAD